MPYFIPFLTSLVLSIFFTILVRKIAIYFKIFDLPGERKIHKNPVPLLGGIAIFISLFLTFFIFKERLFSGNLGTSHWLGFFIGACFLIIGGFLDDKFNLPAKKQIIFPILAVASIIIGGVNIEKITNPLGDFLYFSNFLSIIFVFIWLFLMMYTTKLLDGVDGLVSGLGVIGSLVIFLFTATTKYYQPDIATASIIFSGAALGFLIFNWHPAKIFLGEGGALIIGYVLGVLSIISGGKIAIAFLIMGIPILDVFWTIIRRSLKKKNPFIFADKKHLHHRLLELGFKHSETSIIFYITSLVFGLSALFLQSTGKTIAIFILLLIMLSVIIGFAILDRKENGLK